MGKVMVIVAHPDDEVIGVGGTIAKHIEVGDEVKIVIMCEGKSSRYAEYHELREEILAASIMETKASAKELGLNEDMIVRKNLKDNRLDEYNFLDIVKLLESEINLFQPQIVYTHYGNDINNDHKIVYQAILIASRPLPGSSIKEVYAFETLSSTEFGDPNNRSFQPNHFIRIDAFLKRKLDAMKCYGSELCEYPHPRSLRAISLNAELWGIKTGGGFTEAFQLLRSIRE